MQYWTSCHGHAYDCVWTENEMRNEMRNETKWRGKLGELSESLRRRRLGSVCWAIGGLCLTGADHQKSPTWVFYAKNHDATNRRWSMGRAWASESVSTLAPLQLLSLSCKRPRLYSLHAHYHHLAVMLHSYRQAMAGRSTLLHSRRQHARQTVSNKVC